MNNSIPVDQLAEEASAELDKEHYENAKVHIKRALKVVQAAEAVLENAKREYEVLLEEIRAGIHNDTSD